MNIIKPLISFLILCVFFSCKKNHIEPAAIGINNALTQAGTPTFPLDWETIDFMPTPPGTPTVVVPWGSGASSQFTKEMSNDFRKADGWTLVYNTFNTTNTPDNWYFMLYNVYRGLLRLYYYVPANTNFISSANIVHMLSTEGAYATNSPILNFAGKDVVKADTNYTTTSMVEQWQVARGTWYILQYELAYDQNMSSQNYNTFSFKWPVRSTQVTNVFINGIGSGTLTGSISVPGSNLTVAPSFNIDGSTNNSTTITVNGASDADKLKPTLGTTIVNAIKGGLTSGITGVVKNVLSGLFKKSDAPAEQSVNLKLQAKIDLKGTLTSDYLITAPSFAIPGYPQSNTPGILPAYGNPLGIFYITNKPNLTKTSTTVRREYPDGTPYFRTTYTLSIRGNSYQLIFNPYVTSIATIQNIKADIVSLNPNADNQYIRIHGTKEIISGYTLAYGHVTGGTADDEALSFGTLAVRITFEVVPLNGAPASVISKCFLATVN
jgi:hypothetical protein